MTAINWANPVSGDWDVASNWSTDTVPTSADDVTISASGPYIVTITPVPIHILAVGPLPILNGSNEADSLTFDAPEAALQENAGSLTIAGALTVNSGFVSLNEANTIGSVALTGGTLAVGNGAALGAGTVTLSDGELLATANETLANALSFVGDSTIAAAHGTTLIEEPSNVSIEPGSVLKFGSLGEDGVVVWDAIVESGFPTVNVVAGTLKADGPSLNDIINFGGEPVTVDAGATLDLAGNPMTFPLLGGGAIIDSGTATTLTLAGANFSGSISGPISLVAGGSDVLSGENTYTGATTINTGGTLQLGSGGATGSITGAISISGNGALAIDHDNAFTLANFINGAGSLELLGTGVTTINTANFFSGGTTISAGVLAIGAADAAGTGAISLAGGELLTTANEVISDPLDFSGTSTIAAAHGTTLNEEASSDVFTANAVLNIGAPGEDGTILWHTNELGGVRASAIDIQAGTLKSGDGQLSLLLDDAGQTTIDAGATVDVAGSNTIIPDLLGGGSIINSGAAANLTLGAANSSGSIAGALSVDFAGNASLSGLEDYTGGATLEGPFTVANAGTYDIVSNNGIAGTPASLFINNGLFEKTGGGGVSDITTNFINGGELNVLSGSVKFSGGFTNNGVIHGLVTQSGGVTTVSAATPSDFNGDGLSDLLWQNTSSGQAAVWEMNGDALTGGGPVSPNPGPAWKAIGSGDFTGDGHADILWQNTTTGQASIWEMNENALVGGGAVTPNPGPSWKALGTGDFNGDGLSDILFQNTSSGQVSIWEMNGNKLIGGGAVGPSPGSGWSEIGTGDFNGDGDSDILWQNASTGQLSIWEMNGNEIVGGGTVSSNPGPSWKAIGTGDFYDNGHSDILFQNTSSGQVSIWEMNGTNVIGGGPVSTNPGLAWHAIGTGDFNGDGHSDILFQNTSGQASIWEMNGNTLIGGGPVSPNPGSSWRSVGLS
jgi:autotransporter-associated beta strand protein